MEISAVIIKTKVFKLISLERRPATGMPKRAPPPKDSSNMAK